MFVPAFPCRKLNKKNGFPIVFHDEIAHTLHAAGCTWYPSHLAVNYHSISVIPGDSQFLKCGE